MRNPIVGADSAVAAQPLGLGMFVRVSRCMNKQRFHWVDPCTCSIQKGLVNVCIFSAPEQSNHIMFSSTQLCSL